ncbi:hypothetical protein [Streptomyces sp. NPDC054842]
MLRTYGSAASKCPPPRNSTRTTCGATHGGCPRATRSPSSTARTTRRFPSCGSTPTASSGRELPDDSRGPGIWERRYRETKRWERYLTDIGFKVVSIFLNLPKEEQRTRFLKRIDLPDKNWKFSAADVPERRHWEEYQHAFSQMPAATSTRWAPRFVVPADRKWFARICSPPSPSASSWPRSNAAARRTRC